ncbi:unnamed protein product [Heterobilharzia americana]|nr:unnamed protein product [Heterobilharzia americana]
MHVEYLVVCFFVIMSVVCSENTPNDAELAKIKASPEFKDAKAKVMTVLSSKIDDYVLENLRKNKASNAKHS